jgi:CheY-like chemotaxis protein
MVTATQEPPQEKEPPERIGVVDDSVDNAEVLSLELETAHFKPEVFGEEHSLPYREVDHLVDEIVEGGVDLVICDHRLETYEFAKFSGAELAARLYEMGIPALLLSQYLDGVGSDELRSFRDRLPVVLRRSNVSFSDRESALEVFEKCFREIEGEPSRDRRGYRTIIQILEIGPNIVDVVVPQWDDQKKITIPKEDIISDVEDIKDGMMLFADVNLLANDESELFFRNFEGAPDPSPLDELS